MDETIRTPARYRLTLASDTKDALLNAIYCRQQVSGLTHNLYKYPARFSPQIARAAIAAFTKPGDVVIDPFVGGGTTLVEARALGRIGIGCDISELATFVTRTKTSVLTAAEERTLRAWLAGLENRLNLRRSAPAEFEPSIEHARHLGSHATWPIRKSLTLALSEVGELSNNKLRNFARCILLRAGQKALDGRMSPPSAPAFRELITATGENLLCGAAEFRIAARDADAYVRLKIRRTMCFHGKAADISGKLRVSHYPSAQLVLTSPPYPGVHMLYHRWQIQGGKETAAPFWLANKLDGSGESYYTMKARQPTLSNYYSELQNSFESLAASVTPSTTIVQVVAFSNPKNQIRSYLRVLQNSGFEELFLTGSHSGADGRIWRGVPGRKWYAGQLGSIGSSKEVVLFHRLQR